MLNINPKERLTAFQVLNHPWIKEDGDAPDVPLDNVVLNQGREPVQESCMPADADGNGLIDYEEFVTATVHMNKMDRENHLYTAFQYFDKDNSGYITKEELEQILKEQGLYDAKEIITEADSDNVRKKCYAIFVHETH
ncbi:hypothetical protein GUJ93_ZPchr0039g14211 [Zizania palustris]|uniref:EF-hand domain-containing protein n=1 Tax=Zizania palustris TaxID=103762 RepID=A0A8J5R6R4_ZIZPA|nr:hypothetical protein GUJ93_ZPchr0039g14211 [Zizania palustris]